MIARFAPRDFSTLNEHPYHRMIFGQQFEAPFAMPIGTAVPDVCDQRPVPAHERASPSRLCWKMGAAFASDSLPPWHASQSPTLPPSHNSMMKYALPINQDSAVRQVQRAPLTRSFLFHEPVAAVFALV